MRSLIKGLFLILPLMVLISGCSTKGGKFNEVAKNTIDPDLPGIHINGYITDMTSVAFEWKPIDDTNVKGVVVYRNNPTSDDKKTLHYLGDTHNRHITHYVDDHLKPGVNYQYMFATYSYEGAQSKSSKIFNVKTMQTLTSVEFFFIKSGMPRSAKLIWRPHTRFDVKGYIIERKEGNEAEFVEVGRLDGRLHAEFIDEELDDNKAYIYQLRAITYEGVVSLPTKPIKIITKPLPHTVQELKTTTQLQRKVDLSWGKNSENDIVAYKVYRSKYPDSSFDVVATLKEEHYTDVIEEDGKAYYYQVTAIDEDGLESIPQKKALLGSTLAKPKAPEIVSHKLKENIAYIVWEPLDQRAVKYKLLKTTKNGWFDSKTVAINDVMSKSYEDIELKPGNSYEYQVIAIDKNGMESKPSKGVLFEVEEEEKE